MRGRRAGQGRGEGKGRAALMADGVECASRCGHRGAACSGGAGHQRRCRQWQGSGAAAGSANARGSGAASGRQWRSERERAHSSALRARRQRREEEGGERKGTLVNDFGSIQNQNFHVVT